jgi:hypothetical protein
MARFRFLAASALVAACFISGCAAGPIAPSPAVSPPAAEATTSPTVDPPSPKIPFSGDCASVLLADVQVELFAGGQPQVSEWDRIHGVMPDTAASLARLGGLTCSWTADAGRIGWLSLTMMPAATVPESVIAAHTEFGCYGWSICGRSEIRSGMWVLSETARGYTAGNEMSADEAQVLASAVDAGIEAVFARSNQDLSGVPVEVTEEFWTLPDCTALEQTVAAAAGMTDPEPGLPTDNVPEGPVWEVVKGRGIAAWCPWHEYSASGAVLLADLQLQSGVGSPTAGQLEAASAEAISIPGADAAYRLALGASPSARTREVLAVVGPNRILVRGDRPEEVAAAALAVLNR